MKKVILILLPLILLAVAFLYAIPEYERQKYNFTLRSANGPLSLSDLHGKAVAVYFGYTACPDICPTSLGTITEALNMMKADEVAQIQVIFISVDPERDTPESMKGYVEYFHPNIIGVTGDKEAIDKVAEAYHTKYIKIEGNTAMGYTMGHTSFVHFFDKAGNLSSTLDHSIDPDETMKHFKKALEG